MTAEQLYTALDRAGLTPPVHYCAAPPEWREALERIEVELEAEVFALDDMVNRKEREIRDIEELLKEEREANDVLEKKLEDYVSKDNAMTLARMTAP